MDEKKTTQQEAAATPNPSTAKLLDASTAANVQAPQAGKPLSTGPSVPPGASAISTPAAPAGKSQISFDDFAKLELRVAKIEAAERVEGANKLYKLTIDIGGEKRTLAAGVVQYYLPEELVGKSVIVITNLAPRTIRGITSQGMMLAAEDAAGNVCVLTADKAMPPGSKIR
jgi:methionyl-tRNA synthetase